MSYVIAHHRRGFSLIEAVVAMGVFALLGYVVFDMLVGGMQAFQREEGKTQSLVSATLACEMISNELRQQLYFGIKQDRINVMPAAHIDGVDELGWGESLQITCAKGLDYDETYRPRLVSYTVKYSLSHSGSSDFKCLKRTVLGGEEKVFTCIRLTDLRFQMKDTERADGKKMYWVAIKALGYGERERDDNMLLGLVALDAFGLRARNPYWVEERGVLHEFEGYPPEAPCPAD